MEMYYNYVYAVKKGLDNDFYFKYVVARFDDIKSKSLNVLMKILGNNNLLNMYKHIVILDDNGRKVWNMSIPKEIVNSDINIVCLAPSPFIFVNRRATVE